LVGAEINRTWLRRIYEIIMVQWWGLVTNILMKLQNQKGGSLKRHATVIFLSRPFLYGIWLLIELLFQSVRNLSHCAQFLLQNQRDALISQIYFWNRTLHVSERFSMHHQESSTVYLYTAISNVIEVMLTAC
jgi:hypothetical protein